MPFYRIADRTNYYISVGQGHPVLLLHGISNSGRAWAPQLPALVAAGYRAIVPDHAGHGASDRLHTPFGVADIARDTEALLAHLDVDRFDVVGLSLGGMVAIELALRHPGRVRRLIVANSFDQTATPQFDAMAQTWARTFEQPRGPVLRFEQNWPTLVAPDFQASPDGLRTWQAWHGIAATTDGASLAHVARGIVGFDRAAHIAQLAMPALFIAGEFDRMSPPEISRAMAERAPLGEYQLLRGAAHISNADSAADFNHIMLRFLADTAPGMPPRLPLAHTSSE